VFASAVCWMRFLLVCEAPSNGQLTHLKAPRLATF
jgi:hypothetical protein